MANIGTFTKLTNGNIIGEVRTLNLNARVQLIPTNSASENAPAYRVMAGRAELGAAWEKEAKETGKPFLSLTLDDPSFERAIYANLVESEIEPGTYDLLWNRSKSK